MNLYQINEKIENAINECIDMETGEIIHPEKLEQLNIARNEKREGVALYIKNQLPEIEAIDKEIKALTARKKAKQSRIEWLKKSLLDDMTSNNLQVFETPRVAISFRRSEVLEVTSTDNIPPEFIVEQPPKIDKAGLKKEVKAGFTFDGVQLIKKQNIQIK